MAHGRRSWYAAAAFAIGLFTIAAQTALLREYLVLFRGSELAVGLFFASWFLWIAVAATASSRFPRLREACGRRLDVLLAGQPFAALAGVALLAVARRLAGVPAFEPMPPAALALGAAIATMPACLVTGVAFPAACDRSRRDPASAAAGGYVAEAAGAVAGGLLATAAYLLGVDGLTVTAAAGLAPVAIAVASASSRTTRAACSAAGVLLLAACLPPASGALRLALASVRLSASLEGARLVREVHTPYQRLATAVAVGQRVVLADGAIEATFPAGPDVDADEALLAAQPSGHRLAVVAGQGRYALAVALARDFERVEVVALDGRALEELEAARIDAGGEEAEVARVARVTGDERARVREGADPIDLLVIAAPEPRTLLANRLYTREFLADAVARLAPGGVVAAQAASAENYLGAEVLRYGQSIRATLASVLPEVVVVPGDVATFLASATPGRVTADAETLARRQRERIGARGPFPADAFATRVQPDRLRFANDLYSEPAPGDLVNRDDRPVATFLWLMTFLRMVGSGGGRIAWSIHDAGDATATALLALALLVVLRGRLRRPPGDMSYGACALVTVAGGTTVAATVALLGAYQARVGSVYGEIGVAAALSMAGMAGGAAFARALASRKEGGRGSTLPEVACAVTSATVLAVASLAAGALAGLDAAGARLVIAALLLSTGAVSGAAWVVAAGRLGDAAAARLEAADHWGAAVLSAVAGVGFVALLGVSRTLTTLAGMQVVVAAVAALGILLDTRPGRAFAAGRAGRALAFRSLPGGWAAGGLALVAMVAVATAHLAAGADAGFEARIDPADLKRYEAFTGDEARSSPFEHHRLSGVPPLEGRVGAGSTEAVVTASMAVDPELRGYGGPLNVIVSADAGGTVRGVAVRGHRETPSYLKGLGQFLATFRGRDARTGCSRPGDPFDAMTGATVTRRAVERAVDATCRAVGGRVLGLDVGGEGGASPLRALADPALWWVVVSLAAAIVVHRRLAARWRLALLAACALVGGVAFNLQLSATWLVSLGRFELPDAAANAPLFALTAGVLALAVAFGPAYCAHLCPFGAVQEVASRLSDRLGWRIVPPPRLHAWTRTPKYVGLALVAVSLLDAEPGGVLAWDPLASVFAGDLAGPAGATAVLAVAGSVLVFRFWCRTFCPVGAFLLLFNRVAGLLGLSPPRRHAACDLGVTGPYDIDCIQCSRCVASRPGTEAVRRGSAFASPAFAVLVAATALVVAWSVATGSGAATAASSPGVRGLDMERVMRLIHEGRLSDREATFWKPVDR
jgi:predicted membrane-bound spermidine synthase/Na+-translocating ferredoxin:NAD+ oxidoreductase RnfG subunit